VLFREQTDITCFLLNALLPALDPADVVTKLSEQIQHCLNNANSDVQLLALQQVYIYLFVCITLKLVCLIVKI